MASVEVTCTDTGPFKPGTEIDLHASVKDGGSATAWTWHHDGTVIQGANTSAIHVKVSDATEGSYTATATVAGADVTSVPFEVQLAAEGDPAPAAAPPAATAPAEAPPVFKTEFDETPYAFTPDGKALVIQHSDADGHYLPKLLPLDPSGPPVTLSLNPDGGAAAVSRDGLWVALVTLRGGVPEVYVQPLKGGVTAERVSAAGGNAVTWSRDGKELLYLRPPEIVAVPFRIENGTFRPGAERVWARADGDYLDNTLGVGADGRVLVAITNDRANREIRVVVNWQQEIAKKLK